MQLTQHFSLEEFACHDGSAYPISTVDEFDAERRTWLITRLMPLCQTLETIRAEANEECRRLGFPLSAKGLSVIIDSGYRTIPYDEALYARSAKNGDVAPASSSQHPKGRAADIRHETLAPGDLHNLILRSWRAGRLPRLGGLGRYPHFCHVDVRPRPQDDPMHLAQWTAGRASNRLA